MRDSFQGEIADARDGNRQATERLLLEHYERLESRIASQLPRSLQSVVQVEDILQETFVQAIRRLSQCRATTAETFAAWLDSIASNRVLDTVRSLNCQKRGGGGIGPGNGRPDSSLLEACGWHRPDSTPGRKAARNEVIGRIHAAVDELPSDERDAIRFRYLRGESLEVTARAIHRSPAAVRGLIHRAKRRLRKVMHGSSRWFGMK